MKKTCLWVLIALVFAVFPTAVVAQGLPPSKPEDVGMSAERLGVLDTLMSEALERKDFPGAVILVAHKGKIVWRKAYGQSQWVP
jgi:CubicO group peptidase (beta-lactamase class C family)